jgi:hypothetical protein
MLPMFRRRAAPAPERVMRQWPTNAASLVQQRTQTHMMGVHWCMVAAVPGRTGHILRNRLLCPGMCSVAMKGHAHP